jgi:hypothetical protein
MFFGMHLEQRSATLLQNVTLLQDIAYVLRAITFSCDKGSNFNRAITLRHENGSYAPRAITFKKDTLLCCDKALCNKTKCNVALSL